MSVTHEEISRNGIADTIAAQLYNGTIELQTSGGVEVATIGLSSPAFEDAVAGVATAYATVADNGATGGVIAKAQLKNQIGTPIINCSVGVTGSGEDIELATLTINPGDVVVITDLYYTAPV